MAAAGDEDLWRHAAKVEKTEGRKNRGGQPFTGQKDDVARGVGQASKAWSKGSGSHWSKEDSQRHLGDSKSEVCKKCACWLDHKRKQQREMSSQTWSVDRNVRSQQARVFVKRTDEQNPTDGQSRMPVGKEKVSFGVRRNCVGEGVGC